MACRVQPRALGWTLEYLNTFASLGVTRMEVDEPSASQHHVSRDASSITPGADLAPGRGASPHATTESDGAGSKKRSLGRCVSCGSDLRRSRFQKSDLPRLLLFQVPARCRRCGERQHTFAPGAIFAGEPWRPMKRSSLGSERTATDWVTPFAGGPIDIRRRNAPMVPPELLLDQKRKNPVRGRVDGPIW
jgi:hypothetical protein